MTQLSQINARLGGADAPVGVVASDAPRETGLDPQPSALNPQPSTLNTQTSTLNLEP